MPPLAPAEWKPWAAASWPSQQRRSWSVGAAAAQGSSNNLQAFFSSSFSPSDIFSWIDWKVDHKKKTSLWMTPKLASSAYTDLVVESWGTVQTHCATALTRTNNSSEPAACTPDWSQFLWRGLHRCHGAIAKNVLLWTQYSGGTTLIYMMDVRSKPIQPRFWYQLWIHAWGGLSGARNDVDTALAVCQDSTPSPLLSFSLPPPPPSPFCWKPVVRRLPSWNYNQHLQTSWWVNAIRWLFFPPPACAGRNHSWVFSLLILMGLGMI